MSTLRFVSLSIAIAGLSLALGACRCHPRPDAWRPARVPFESGQVTARPTPIQDPEPPIPPPSAAADVENYVAYGLAHNAELRATFERWHAARERVDVVEGWPDPVLSFAQMIEDVQTRTGPQERRYGISQTVPWFGKLGARGRVAMATADAFAQEVDVVRLRVEREIRVAFYDYAYLAESTRITRAVLDLLRQLEPIVQRRIAAGERGQADLLRLQVEFGRVENELKSFERLRHSMSARLASAMNWPERDVLPWPQLSEPNLRALDVAMLHEDIEQRSPALEALRHRIRGRREAAELADIERWPDFTFGLDYFETGSSVAPTPDGGDDPWGVRVMFSLPFGSAKYDAASRAAERDASAAHHELSDRRATLRVEAENLAFRLDDATRQIELYRDTLLPRARESLDVTRAAYRAGEATLLDLIDSERALLELETGYWRACRDHYQSAARVRELAGGSIE